MWKVLTDEGGINSYFMDRLPVQNNPFAKAHGLSPRTGKKIMFSNWIISGTGRQTMLSDWIISCTDRQSMWSNN